MKIDVKTIDNKAAGDITLADAVFGVAPRADIVARPQAVWVSRGAQTGCR